MTTYDLFDRSAKRLTDEAVREIVRRIVGVAQPDRVILFGSAATGQMTPDSDIDLLIIERKIEDLRLETRRIALADLPAPFDVIVMERERFEETRGVIGGIAWPASRYGKVIYEAA
jgi:predicted nucleotidyltransferase